jgi:hypothetical protein
VSGEDYIFKVSCQREEGKRLRFRIMMEYQGDDDDDPSVNHPRRTIDFPYDLDVRRPFGLCIEGDVPS